MYQTQQISKVLSFKKEEDKSFLQFLSIDIDEYTLNFRAT